MVPQTSSAAADPSCEWTNCMVTWTETPTKGTPMSDVNRPYDPSTPGAGPYDPQSDVTAAPVAAQRLRLDAGRYWGGALATVLVCALIGLAAWFVIQEVAGQELDNPPFGDSAAASWAIAGALFALLGAVLLHLLVLTTPRPASFFGWIVALATIILAALPFAGGDIDVSTVLTAVVWLVLGVAVWSLLTGVLSRTVVRETVVRGGTAYPPVA